MFILAFALAACSALFYCAGNTGSPYLVQSLCNYGDTFSQHPTILVYGAFFAFIWAALLRVDQI